tara:strand:+ start:100119 stop:101123 length:1005 start_codon:yes stop_codon:yes gene_type:complete
MDPVVGDGSIKFYTQGTAKGYFISKASTQGYNGTILRFEHYNPFGGGSTLMNFVGNSLVIGNPVITNEKFYVNVNSNFAGTVKINPEFASGNLFQIGLNGSIYNLNSTNGGITSTIGNNRSQFYASSSTTYLGLRDNNNGEIFKVSNDPTLGSFIHMPKTNSRIVIGGFGDYRFSEGKLIVKQGNAIIEGNIIADGNITTEVDLFVQGNSYVNGKVGIGTSNPDEKLTVKGKIHAEEVKVDLNVPPDYVFEKFYTGESTLKSDYQMPTLQEIEDFTKLNFHLPNVPSAEEIQKDGLKLSKMTAILLQKIEELTLYTIEQEKRIKILETKLESNK